MELCQVGQRACGKLVALDALLRSFGRRDKVLLFSYSVQMLDVLAAFATYKGAYLRACAFAGWFAFVSCVLPWKCVMSWHVSAEAGRSHTCLYIKPQTQIGYDYVRLDGNITGNERQAAIESKNPLTCLAFVWVIGRSVGWGSPFARVCT